MTVLSWMELSLHQIIFLTSQHTPTICNENGIAFNLFLAAAVEPREEAAHPH